MANRSSAERDIAAVDYDFIRGELVRLNIQQLDLADRLGRGRPYLSQKLNGKVPFKLWEVDMIADVLGCTTDRLFKRGL